MKEIVWINLWPTSQLGMDKLLENAKTQQFGYRKDEKPRGGLLQTKLYEFKENARLLDVSQKKGELGCKNFNIARSSSGGLDENENTKTGANSNERQKYGREKVMGAPKKWIHSVHFRKMFEGENICYISLQEYDRRFGKGREYEFHHRLGDDERMEERSGGRVAL